MHATSHIRRERLVLGGVKRGGHQQGSCLSLGQRDFEVIFDRDRDDWLHTSILEVVENFFVKENSL